MALKNIFGRPWAPFWQLHHWSCWKSSAGVWAKMAALAAARRSSCRWQLHMPKTVQKCNYTVCSGWSKDRCATAIISSRPWKTAAKTKKRRENTFLRFVIVGQGYRILFWERANFLRVFKVGFFRNLNSQSLVEFRWKVLNSQKGGKKTPLN